MDIKKNITITLSDLDLKEIIVKYLKTEGYDVLPKNIKFSIGTRMEGYGMGEHSVSYFDGVIVSCNDK